jgi:Aspartyl protease
MQDLKTKWLYDNYPKLGRFKGQYIAHNEKGIIASNFDILLLLKEVKPLNIPHYICYIPQDFEKYQINMLKLLPVNKNEWKPVYPVKLQLGEHPPLQLEMLVDSGADISVIPYDTGIALGLQSVEGEIFEQAAGIGGVISYALRKITLEIDGFPVLCPIAWIQNQYTRDLILGREVVFDVFDIEFKQKDEEIIFKKRADALDA